MALAALESGSQPPDDQLRRMHRDFLANLNFEIRTPLSGILGMADLLLETDLDARQQDYTASVRACAADLLEHLNATLELLELAAGRLALDESEFNLPEALECAAARCRKKAEAKGLAFSTRFEDLPEAVTGDSVRFGEILSHLLDNAVRFTDAGEIELKAAGMFSAGRFRLKVTIRDTGIGLAPDQIEAMAGSFRHEEGGLARPYQGLSPVLVLVKKLAQFMRGELTVESEPEKGTVVSLAVPLRIPADPAAAGAQRRPVARSRRVLVVEHNPVSRRTMSEMLARREYAIETVPSGEEALSQTGQRRFDAILMDLQMPGMDGFEAAMRIRMLPGYDRVPILALTPHAGDDYRMACLSAGMQGFLEKPVDAEKLLAALERVMGE